MSAEQTVEVPRELVERMRQHSKGLVYVSTGSSASNRLADLLRDVKELLEVTGEEK